MAEWKNVLQAAKEMCEPIEELLTFLLTMKEARKESNRNMLKRLGMKHFQMMHLLQESLEDISIWWPRLASGECGGGSTTSATPKPTRKRADADTEPTRSNEKKRARREEGADGAVGRGRQAG